jgi:biopolymer transport protein ExbD
MMAPMIDMVFLLIIFFMVASHLSSSKNVDLQIPEAKKGVIPKERPDRWTINIRQDGSMFSGQQEVTLDELKQQTTARMKADPDVKVYVRADKEAPHKYVKAVMNAMSAAGVGDFIFGVHSTGGGAE